MRVTLVEVAGSLSGDRFAGTLFVEPTRSLKYRVQLETWR